MAEKINISKVNSEIKHKRNYGKTSEAMRKYVQETGLSEESSIKSLSSSATACETKENEQNNGKSDGKSTRCISNISEKTNASDKFYSLESINVNDNGLIEGFTKYIGYNEDPNKISTKLSPALRFDIGGQVHKSNTINNKYFEANVPPPHIHYCTVGSNPNAMTENAISFDNLIVYLQDLSGQCKTGAPHKDIMSNSFGMPYLQILKEKGPEEFKNIANKMIRNLKDSQKLVEQMKAKRQEMKSQGKSDIEINKEVESLKYELLSKISNVTLQANLEKHCKNKALELSNKNQMGN